MPGTVRGWLLVVACAVASATSAGCGATPLSGAEFEQRNGVAPPDQLAGVAGGDDGSGRVTERRTVGATAPAAPSVGFGDGAAVVAAARVRLPGERSLDSVVLYDGYASVTTVAANGDVDNVFVRGPSADDPTPRPSAFADPDPASRFHESEVDWGVIPSLVERTPAELGMATAKVSHVIVEKNLPFTPDLVVRVYVSDVRHSGRIDFRTDGSVLRMFPG